MCDLSTKFIQQVKEGAIATRDREDDAGTPETNNFPCLARNLTTFIVKLRDKFKRDRHLIWESYALVKDMAVFVSVWT